MKKSLISALLFLLPFISIAEIPDWVKNPPKGEYIGISFIDDDYLKEESALISAFTAYMLDQPHNEVDSTKRNLVGYGTLYNDSIKFDIARIAVLPTNEIAVSIKKGEQNSIKALMFPRKDIIEITTEHSSYKHTVYWHDNDTIEVNDSTNLLSEYSIEGNDKISIFKTGKINDIHCDIYNEYKLNDNGKVKLENEYWQSWVPSDSVNNHQAEKATISEEDSKEIIYRTLEFPYVTSIRKKIFEQKIENFEQEINALNSNQEDDNGIKEEISPEEKDKILMKEFEEEIFRALFPYAELEFDGYKSGDNVLMFNYQGIFKKTNSLGLSYLYTLCHIQCCKDWFTYQKIDKKPVYPDKVYCLPPLTVNQISIIGDELYIFVDRPEELIIPINNNR